MSGTRRPLRLIAALFALGLVAGACSTGGKATLDLSVGDCFDDPSAVGEVVATVDAIDCSEPHQYEVIATRTESDVVEGDALEEERFEFCTGREFSDYIGIDYVDSIYNVFWYTEAGTDGNDSGKMICAIETVDQSKVEGSAKGSRE